MTTSTGALSLAELRVGEQVQAWVGPMMRYVGVVELASPRFGVIWIRDAALGERIMLDLGEYRLYSNSPGSGRARQCGGM
jgi:hypothetical protein